MKRHLLLLLLVAFTASCKNRTATDQSTPCVASMTISFADSTQRSYSYLFGYDDQQQLIHSVIDNHHGEKEVQDFQYKGDSVIYRAHANGMNIWGSYHLDANRRADTTYDVYEMENVTMAGENFFVYKNNRIEQIKTVISMNEEKRDTVTYYAKWTNNNWTGMNCDWSEYNVNNEAIKVDISMDYNTRIYNHANIDLNIMLQRFFLNNSLISYHALTACQCGQKSEHMLSHYYHNIQFRQNNIRNEEMDYRFEYKMDNRQRVSAVRIVNGQNQLFATLKIDYK